MIVSILALSFSSAILPIARHTIPPINAQSIDWMTRNKLGISFSRSKGGHLETIDELALSALSPTPAAWKREVIFDQQTTPGYPGFSSLTLADVDLLHLAEFIQQVYTEWIMFPGDGVIPWKRCTCMKMILCCFLTSIVTGFGVSASFADTYISGNLGVVIVNDSDTDDGFDTGEFTFDTGAGIVWALGSSFQNGGRVEAELGYRSNSFDEFKVDGGGKVGLYGDISSSSLMGNAYYDISTEGSFSPFIGAGLGFAYIEADFDYFDRDDDEDDTVFAYQLILGGSFASSEQLSVDLQYRYFATDDPEFDGLDAEYSTHNVMIGFRRSF